MHLTASYVRDLVITFRLHHIVSVVVLVDKVKMMPPFYSAEVLFMPRINCTLQSDLSTVCTL